MELFKLFGTIAINNAAANEEISETTEKAEGAGTRVSSAFKKIGTAVVTYLTVDKIISFGKACIEASANAQAMESQFTQVFGDLETDATASLSAIAKEAGIVENRMKGSFTKIAAFAKTSGMDTDEALSLTERAMKAVADSAAFYDRSLEETTESLQSFLKGNYENDAALGLSATETTRNAAANELYGKSFNELSEAQKQLTLLQMVEDANALSGALGQAARESATWTNQTGNLKQAWTDFTAMIGEKFLPLAIEVVEKISELVVWMTEHEDVVTILAIAIGTLTAALIAYNVAQTMATTGMTLATVAGTAFGTVMAFLTSPITLVVAAIGALIAAGVLLVKNWDTVKSKASELWEKLTQVFDSIKAACQNLISAAGNIFKGLVSAVKSPLNTVIGLVNNFIRGLNNIKIPAWVPGLGGKGINIPTIPMLEKGGILEKGQVGLLEGSGAEAVVPLERNSAWINAVAKDMESAVGGNRTTQLLEMILEALQNMDDGMSDKLSGAFTSVKLNVNNREFARMVKAVN